MHDEDDGMFLSSSRNHQIIRRKCMNQQKQQHGDILGCTTPPQHCTRVFSSSLHPISKKNNSSSYHQMISMKATSGGELMSTIVYPKSMFHDNSIIQRRLDVIGKHLRIVDSPQTISDLFASPCSSKENNNTNKTVQATNTTIQSESKKKNWKEILMNMFHLSKWMIIVISATPCLIITIFSRIVRNMTIGTMKNVIFPLIRLKERLMARFFKSKMTTNNEGMTLHEKEQRAKDYVILTHLYLIHPIIVFFCKLFFWAFFNRLTVLYESDIARNLKKLNAFEYYHLINEKNPIVKVTKTLSLKEEQAIRQKGPFIFAIGNQRSLADGIVELAYKTQNSVTIMNVEMALFPFFGWISYGVGSQVIIRQIPKQSWEVIDNMRRLMKRGIFQTYIYPEGDRQTSASRELLPYKMGLFVLAIETQASIIPVIHYGVDDIWPYNNWRIYSRNKAYVVMGEPIETKGMVLNQRFELMEIYRQRIKEMIQRMEERIANQKK